MSSVVGVPFFFFSLAKLAIVKPNLNIEKKDVKIFYEIEVSKLKEESFLGKRLANEKYDKNLIGVLSKLNNLKNKRLSLFGLLLENKKNSIKNITNNLVGYYLLLMTSLNKTNNVPKIKNIMLLNNMLFFRPKIIEASYDNSCGEVEALSIELEKNLESGLYKSYIFHGKLRTGDHYVNIEQFNNNIVYNDPSGETVKDMFETFIIDNLKSIKLKFIKHKCKPDMLQYNSGLCELFSVKFAFYRQRLAITEEYYEVDIVKNEFDNRFFKLFRYGLLESAFSKMEDREGTILKSFSNSYLEERISILKEQEENLLGIKGIFSISKIPEILLEDACKKVES